MPQTTGAPVPSSSQLATPMPACRRISASAADRSLAAIARTLAKNGYSSSIPSWDGHAYLRISNARHAHTDLTITPHDDITWEYRSVRYPHTSERSLIAVAIELLDPGNAEPQPALPPASRQLTQLGAIRHALTRHGLTAAITGADDDIGPVLTVTNPASPCRGTITISSDGELAWTIHTPHHPDGGIHLPDIAAAITRALTRADSSRQRPARGTGMTHPARTITVTTRRRAWRTRLTVTQPEHPPPPPQPGTPHYDTDRALELFTRTATKHDLKTVLTEYRHALHSLLNTRPP